MAVSAGIVTALVDVFIADPLNPYHAVPVFASYGIAGLAIIFAEQISRQSRFPSPQAV